jgi:hypothetical protein
VKSSRPPTKKAKVASTTAGKFSRGRKIMVLSRLPDMPLDILFEVSGLDYQFVPVKFLCIQIFRFLAPVDLLSLARSSKSLRETLMTRNAVTVWKAAARYRVANVPRCPEDMSEPAWANLIFGRSKCHVRGHLTSYVFFAQMKDRCAENAVQALISCCAGGYARIVATKGGYYCTSLGTH